MQKERLLELLQQYVAGTLSLSGTDELSVYMKGEDNKEAILDALAILLEQNAGKAHYDEKRFTPLLDTILRADRQAASPATDMAGMAPAADKPGLPMAREEQPFHAIRPLRAIRRARWIAAASVVLVAFLTGIYLRTPPKPRDNPAAGSLVREIPPPRSANAVLTLANGSVIALDSAGNGTLAVQGSMELIKLGDGLLTCQAAAPSAAGTSPSGYNTLSVPRGSKVTILQLADGTKVWLNAESSLKYPVAFSGGERKVEITGEVYFEVTRDPAMPFIVKKNDTQVEVLGTHFNVNAYDDEASIRITLLEGSVRVTGGHTPASLKTQVLIPGQQAQVNEHGEISVRKEIDPDEVMAWKEGKFRFRDADIRIIMRQISRWYDVDIAYQGTIPHGGLSGFMPRTKNASELLEVLQETGIVHFGLEDKKIVVFPGPGK